MDFIGIDPGLTGAVVIIRENFVEIYDTPITRIKKGKTFKNEYMPSRMASLFRDVKPNDCHVFIEKVSAMPGQGVTSMFNFGKGYGLWIGIIAAMQFPVTFVTPQAWKKVTMKGMPDKDSARIRACELFPAYSDYFKRKRDIGRADAILIAEYGRQSHIPHLQRRNQPENQEVPAVIRRNFSRG